MRLNLDPTILLESHEYFFPLSFFDDALEIVPAFPLAMIGETVLREVVGADFFRAVAGKCRIFDE